MMISIPANMGFFKPKNRNDHKAFKANWMAKKIKALLTAADSCSIRFQTSPAATPIIAYNMLQTGAKTQLGGLKLGFTSVGYQVVIAERVTMPEK